MSWIESFKEAIGIKKQFNVHEYLDKNPKLKEQIAADKKRDAKAVEELLQSVKAVVNKQKADKKEDDKIHADMVERLARLNTPAKKGGNKSIKRKNIRRNKSIKRKKTRSIKY
jgi:hypothetical protein